MAGIEFSVLSRQCLSGHIPNRDILASEVLAWETERTPEMPLWNLFHFPCVF
jgi:hypothetical protein